MPGVKLSDRMAAVARLVPAGASVCDVGCDHGFVAIYLVEEKISPRVIAMDINTGPLLRAKQHIENALLSTYIETRLSDGLEKLAPGETECMIAAGMGGRLIVKILSDCPEKVGSLSYLVLQPQSELFLVRNYLRTRGFVIRKEDMILEDGKFYPMMLVETKGSGIDCDGELKEGGTAEAEADRAYRERLEDEFGPCLIKDRHPVLLQYLDWWEGQQNKILKEAAAYPERCRQVEEELGRIRDVRRKMYEVL